MKNVKKLSLLLFLAATIICSCKKESGTFTVLLTDAPGTYEQVNVEILSVEVHIEGSKKATGWYELQTNSGVYDLLTLQNTTTVLASGEKFPAGDITEIRLMLGSNHSVKVGGQVYSMTVPSGSETGIKIIGRSLVKKEDQEITLDFDAEQSVVPSGNGYILQPVIKVID